jgi:hypothetical protein
VVHWEAIALRCATTPMQLTIETVPNNGGGNDARWRQVDTFTHGETLDEVRENALEAVQGCWGRVPRHF